MKTDTRIVIGATIGIVILLIVLGGVFDVDMDRGLSTIGFIFVIALPTYIWYRKQESEKSNATDSEQHAQIQRCLQVIGEIQEYLDGSIEGFKDWGKLIKGWEKEDEKAYYAEVALKREVGIDTGGLSAEMGEEVKYLIRIQRMLWDIEYYLRRI